MDLSSLPLEDLKALKEAHTTGDYSKVSLPSLKAYKQQILQESQAQTQSLNPQQIPDAADKASQGNKETAKPTMNQAPMEINRSRGAMAQDIADSQDRPSQINSSLAKMAIAAGGAGLGGMAAEGLGTLGTAGVNAGVAALQKYLGNKVDQMPDSTEGVLPAAVGAGVISAGAGALGSGLSKGADWLQQKAMGLSKYLPGVGTQAIKSGVWGTKAGMAGKVENALQGIGDHAGEVIGKMGRIDSSEAAQPLTEYANSLKVGDNVPGHSQDDFAQAMKRAAEVSSRGDTPASQGWQYSKAAGAAGYKNQKAMQSESAYLAQLEQQGYSNALKEGFEKENPGSDNEVADDFTKMSKLYKAQSALNQPESISKGLPWTRAIAPTIGAAAGGGLGALAGVGADAAARSPLVQSLAAKGINAAGNLSSKLEDPTILQSLFGAANSSQK